jgi:hypothetical protein
MGYIRDVNGRTDKDFEHKLLLEAEKLDNMCDGLNAKVTLRNALLEGDECKIYQIEDILKEISKSIKDEFFITFEDEGEYGRLYFKDGKVQYVEADIVYREPSDSNWE